MKKFIFFLVVTSFFISDCYAQRKFKTVNFDSSGQPGVIKAMTFNVRVDTVLDAIGNSWNSRKEIVYETMASNAADVVGIQEALNKQVQHIQNAFPQYANYMAGRDNGKQKGESCAIFFRTDRFELNDRGTFWFSDTPEKPGSKSWGNIWPRICTWVHLIDKHTGSGFYVYNVHLDVFSQNSREKSAELLAQRITGRKTSDPYIIMGDFNMELNNPAMAYLLNAADTIDVWQSLNPVSENSGTAHGFRGKVSGGRIDHIPVSKDIVALDVKTDRYSRKGKYPSDHFPVIAKLLLTNVNYPEATAVITPEFPKTENN